MNTGTDISANPATQVRSDAGSIFPKTKDGIIVSLREIGALLVHDGDIERPHIGMNGGHMATFFDARFFKQWAFMFDAWTSELLNKLRQSYNVASIERVVGHGKHASELSRALAYHIASTQFRDCLCAATELPKARGGDGVIMSGSKIGKGEKILITKDMVTEGRGLIATIQFIKNAGGEVAPYLPVIINASGTSHIHGLEIVSLLNYHIPFYSPEVCPLCKAHSPVMSATKIREGGLYE